MLVLRSDYQKVFSCEFLVRTIKARSHNHTFVARTMAMTPAFAASRHSASCQQGCNRSPSSRSRSRPSLLLQSVRRAPTQQKWAGKRIARRSLVARSSLQVHTQPTFASKLLAPVTPALHLPCAHLTSITVHLVDLALLTRASAFNQHLFTIAGTNHQLPSLLFVVIMNLW